MDDSRWTSTSMPYITPGQGDAWGAEAVARGGRGAQRIVFAGEVAPDGEVRALLGLAGGEAAVLRRRVMSLDGRPVELVSTFYPAAIALGTPLADAAKIPGGAVTLLARLGHVGRKVQEDVTARPLTAEERDMLTLDTTDPVLTLTRLTRSEDGRPIQVDVMVMPGGRLRYELERS